MTAREAHRLRVGDVVVAPFSNSHRTARIIDIDWPHFVIHTQLANGQFREQRNRYRALYSVAEYTRCYGHPKPGILPDPAV